MCDFWTSDAPVLFLSPKRCVNVCVPPNGFIKQKNATMSAVVRFFKKKKKQQPQIVLTVVLLHSFGDLKEDPGVAGDHDDQRQQEQAGEGEHVVGCFVPASQKTPAGGALSEVLRKDDGHAVKDEYLQEGQLLHDSHSNSRCDADY